MTTKKSIASTEALVSVIIPVFNTGERMRKCLDSVIGQTWSNLEIILIDDCSTDELTLQMMQEYAEKDSRFKILKNTTNKYPAFNRNLGVDNCQGAFLTFVDSDDVLEPEFVSVAVNALQTNNTDFVLTTVTKGSDEQSISTHPKWLVGLDIPKLSTKVILNQIDAFSLPQTVHGKMFNAQAYRAANIKFEAKATISEDVIWALTCFLKLKTVSMVSYISYHYIIYQDSLCHNLNFQKVLSCIDLIYHLHRFIQYHNIQLSNENFLFRVSCEITSLTKYFNTYDEFIFSLQYYCFTLKRCGFYFEMSKDKVQESLELYQNKLKLKNIRNDHSEDANFAGRINVYRFLLSTLEKYNLDAIPEIDEETYFNHYVELFVPEELA